MLGIGRLFDQITKWHKIPFIYLIVNSINILENYYETQETPIILEKIFSLLPLLIL